MLNRFNGLSRIHSLVRVRIIYLTLLHHYKADKVLYNHCILLMYGAALMSMLSRVRCLRTGLWPCRRSVLEDYNVQYIITLDDIAKSEQCRYVAAQENSKRLVMTESGWDAYYKIKTDLVQLLELVFILIWL